MPRSTKPQKELIQNLVASQTGISTGSIPPNPPFIGQRWIELDLSDKYVELWSWSGSRWISTNTYNFAFVPPTSSTTNVANNPTFGIDGTAFDLLLLNMVVTGVQGSNATAASNWTLSLDRLAQPGTTSTNITTLNTFSPTLFTAGAITTVSHNINQLINVVTTGIKALRVTESRLGTPAKFLSYTINYKKVRR